MYVYLNIYILLFLSFVFWLDHAVGWPILHIFYIHNFFKVRIPGPGKPGGRHNSSNMGVSTNNGTPKSSI